ncbi:uncharacterized protein DC041_0004716 [Schistosoma bovis]|uniref:Uncharacterized protein n=1 Tax=Schistosoma bovis TaxID=6184 RepID=A0A430Q7K2_SCHBO|nr:uncharacterized protein DC041_0004716 [Schistosoma bovis]
MTLQGTCMLYKSGTTSFKVCYTVIVIPVSCLQHSLHSVSLLLYMLIR